VFHIKFVFNLLLRFVTLYTNKHKFLLATGSHFQFYTELHSLMTALVHLCHHLRRTNFKEPNVCTTFTEINQMVQNLFMGSRHTYTGIQSGTTA